MIGTLSGYAPERKESDEPTQVVASQAYMATKSQVGHVDTTRGHYDNGAAFWSAYGRTVGGSTGAVLPGDTPAMQLSSGRAISVGLPAASRGVRGDDDMRLPIEPRTYLSSTKQWQQLLEGYEGWDVPTMMRIIDCESHGDENAVSPDGANVGAYQLSTVHGFSYEDSTDPVKSTELAHDVWLSQGYSAWACY